MRAAICRDEGADPGGARLTREVARQTRRAAIGGGTSGRSATQLVGLVERLGYTADPVVQQTVASVVIRERVLD